MKSNLKICTVVGTRPEIIRLSQVINKVSKNFNHVLINTNQNYDFELNKVFFEEMKIAKPKYNLKLKGKTIEIWVGDDPENKGFFNRIEEHVAKFELPPLPYGKIFENQISQKIFGPPGTGKTTKLIGLVEEAIKSGVLPNDIAFISFSNGAANVAKNRVSEALPEFGKLDFPNFSTMHSLATRVGQDAGKVLMEEEHFKAFDPQIDTWKEWTELGNPLGLVERFKHPILDALSYSIATCQPMNNRIFDLGEFNEVTRRFAHQNAANAAVDKVSYVLNITSNQLMMQFDDTPIDKQQEFLDSLVVKYVDEFNAYKNTNNLINFDDVITKVSGETFPDELIPTFDLLIIDEAQDLTLNLWIFAKKLLGKSKTAYIAGDDDQAIMIGIGASPETFVNLKTTEPDNPLENSHRISQAARDYVDRGVMPILEKLPGRSGITWVPNEKKGSVNSGYRVVVSKPGEEKNWVYREEFSPTSLLRKVEQDYKAAVANDKEAAVLFYRDEGVDYLKKFLFDKKIAVNDGDTVFKKAADILTDGSLNILFEAVGRGIISSEHVFEPLETLETLRPRQILERLREASSGGSYLVPDWLLMAPTKATGERLSKALLDKKIPHFYRNRPVLDAQTTKTKIRVQTVHISKGDQAQNTAIIVERFGDVAMLVNDPRLAYVALTRSQNRMYARVVGNNVLGDMKKARGQWPAMAAKFEEMFPIG